MHARDLVYSNGDIIHRSVAWLCARSTLDVGLSILFVGYIITQVPSSLLLDYAGRPSFQIKNHQGIVAYRFIVGVVEPYFAGILFISIRNVFCISIFQYTSQTSFMSGIQKKSWLSERHIFFGSLISGAVGNPIAASTSKNLASSLEMGAWQWLYIIDGFTNVFIGITICTILPDFPGSWTPFSPDMERVANRRLAIDAAESYVDDIGGTSQIKSIKLVFLDPKAYMLAITYISITGAVGFQAFFPTLSATLGYSHVISLLVASPYVFIVFYVCVHGWVPDKIANCGTINAWISNAIPRPPAQHAVALAFINSIGNSDSIWMPFTYFPPSASHYRPALGVCIGLKVITLEMFISTHFYLQMQNRQLERLQVENSQLTERYMREMQKTADFKGIDIEAARMMQKGYQYMLRRDPEISTPTTRTLFGIGEIYEATLG
ncbi:hypothetical protein K432DRAFT_412754 [Lepidopterella palustris CBS 459.81]|uniref:MFS general substrate transporter n=1 Tax=Lepidopterella palustris CBS 459.81 TaxID=1314670 RepID=A0A8E2ELG3_9PEZI|nr:hypothetical protein K432DRAFT_412754 [Lepidopterella palustris CBS 459.81]